MANNKNRIKEKVDEEEKKKELGELRRDKDAKADEEKRQIKVIKRRCIRVTH